MKKLVALTLSLSFLEEMCILNHSGLKIDNDPHLPRPFRKGFLISEVELGIIKGETG